MTTMNNAPDKTIDKEITILVVDDISDNLDLLVEILKPHYKVKAANNGQRALHIANSDNPPDIILLDVMMPVMNGLEVCERLKASEATRDIPIIFVTAMGESSDEEKGLALGAVDYITKPIRAPIVLARVKNHLALRETRQQLSRFLDKLACYIPPQVYQAIMQGSLDARLGTRREKLTIFFSDIVEFTALSENLDPEDLSFLLNTYLTEMAKIVLKYGGTLDKFIGDAVLVFFGAPESKGLESDALACIEMAQEMQQTVSRLAEDAIKRGIGRPLTVRMGISTGYCSVGNFGSKERMDYTVIGRHVNLAARLEEAAKPGHILISKETWSLVNSRVNCMQKDPVNAKGFSEPIDVFQVAGLRGESSQQERLQVSHPGFKLELDPMEVTGENRVWVVNSLREALKSLGKDSYLGSE